MSKSTRGPTTAGARGSVRPLAGCRKPPGGRGSARGARAMPPLARRPPERILPHPVSRCAPPAGSARLRAPGNRLGRQPQAGILFDDVEQVLAAGPSSSAGGTNEQRNSSRRRSRRQRDRREIARRQRCAEHVLALLQRDDTAILRRVALCDPTANAVVGHLIEEIPERRRQDDCRRHCSGAGIARRVASGKSEGSAGDRIERQPPQHRRKHAGLARDWRREHCFLRREGI